MPYINITLFTGQPKERKETVAKRITQVIKEELQVPDEKIWITYQDVPSDEWSIGGTMCTPVKKD